MNLHLLPREFYLSRHGQSMYNLEGKIGGDSGLSEAGLEYARRLADFAKDVVATEVKVDEETGEEKRVARPARLWTSTLRRTKETAQFIKKEKMTFKWDNHDEGRPSAYLTFLLTYKLFILTSPSLSISLFASQSDMDPV